MGDDPDDDAPTGIAPTELGAAIDETEAHTAWALDDGPEVESPRRLTPGRITALAVGSCVVVVVIAAGVAGYHLRQSPPPVTVATPTPTVNSSPDAVRTPTTAAPRPSWGGGPAARTLNPPPPKPQPGTGVTLPPKPPMTALLPDLMPSNFQFLGNVRMAGFNMSNPDMVIWRGHEACLMLREGEPRDLMARKLIAIDPTVTMGMAMQFIEIVATTYPNCP